MNRTKAPDANTLRQQAHQLVRFARECVGPQNAQVFELAVHLANVADDPLNHVTHYIDESGQISNLYGEILMYATRAAQAKAEGRG